MVVILFILGVIISIYIAHFIVKILEAPFAKFLTDLFDAEKSKFWLLMMKLIIYLVSLAGALSPRPYYYAYTGKPKAIEELFWGLVDTVKGSLWRILTVLFIFFISFLITSAFLKKEKSSS